MISESPTGVVVYASIDPTIRRNARHDWMGGQVGAPRGNPSAGVFRRRRRRKVLLGDRRLHGADQSQRGLLRPRTEGDQHLPPGRGMEAEIEKGNKVEEVDMRITAPRWPSPAMVVALSALVISMAGTGYAATRLPAHSVGSRALKKNAVTAAKIRARAVRSRAIAPKAVNGAKVANNSLTGADINEATLELRAGTDRPPSRTRRTPAPPRRSTPCRTAPPRSRFHRARNLRRAPSPALAASSSSAAGTAGEPLVHNRGGFLPGRPHRMGVQRCQRRSEREPWGDGVRDLRSAGDAG